MDTYSKALIGSRSRASGEYFEGMISAACQFYEEKGISVIEKTPEPMRVLKPYDRKRGQFICCFAKQAQPDFKGILMDATMVLFDAKHTDKERIMRDDVFIKIKTEIPYKVGVYCPCGNELKSVKKAVRADRERPVSEMLLMMFRSATRDMVRI